MEVKTSFQQVATVQVIRALLKEPIVCEFCGNKRYQVVKCESCDRTEQILKET